MPITPPENAALFLLCGKKYSPETGSSKNGSDTFKAIGAPSRKNSFTSGRRFIISHSVLKSLKDKKKKSIIPTAAIGNAKTESFNKTSRLLSARYAQTIINIAATKKRGVLGKSIFAAKSKNSLNAAPDR